MGCRIVVWVIVAGNVPTKWTNICQLLKLTTILAKYTPHHALGSWNYFEHTSSHLNIRRISNTASHKVQVTVEFFGQMTEKLLVETEMSRFCFSSSIWFAWIWMRIRLENFGLFNNFPTNISFVILGGSLCVCLCVRVDKLMVFDNIRHLTKRNKMWKMDGKCHVCAKIIHATTPSTNQNSRLTIYTVMC